MLALRFQLFFNHRLTIERRNFESPLSLYALDPQVHLAVLQNFDRLVAKRHWRPLKQGEQRLRLGLPCLENAVKMVEGAIAIEQLKSQRQLARTMVAASSSVGATAAAAVAIAPNLDMNAASPW